MGALALSLLLECSSKMSMETKGTSQMKPVCSTALIQQSVSYPRSRLTTQPNSKLNAFSSVPCMYDTITEEGQQEMSWNCRVDGRPGMAVSPQAMMLYPFTVRARSCWCRLTSLGSSELTSSEKWAGSMAGVAWTASRMRITQNRPMLQILSLPQWDGNSADIINFQQLNFKGGFSWMGSQWIISMIWLIVLFIVYQKQEKKKEQQLLNQRRMQRQSAREQQDDPVEVVEPRSERAERAERRERRRQMMEMREGVVRDVIIIKESSQDQQVVEVKRERAKERKAPEEKEICSICIQKRDTNVVLPCLHKFHRRCIESWAERSHECPVCRSHFEHDHIERLVRA